MPNCYLATSQISNVFDASAHFAARHLPPGTRVCCADLPYITGTVHAASGLLRDVVFDPLVAAEDTPPIPSWLPHAHLDFPQDPSLNKTLSVQALRGIARQR